MLYTILQIIAFQALFLLVYDLFLKRETFFNYNRTYLLLTAILSLVLPFIKLPKLKTMAVKDVVIQLPEVFIGAKIPTDYEMQIAEQAGIVMSQPKIPIWQIITIIGMVIAAVIFIYKIAKLFWLKHSNPKRWQGNVLIVQLIKSTAAFSFFNTIFLGERIPETEKPTIYKHELIHIKEWHSADLLFFEIFKIVFWFNPLVYVYQNRIKELHEYIADAKAVKQNGKAEYYQSLLNQVFDVNHMSFTNTFFKKSLIKKRIAMLQKSKSKQGHLLKYTLLIPLVLVMLVYTSTEVRAQQKNESNTKVSKELTDDEKIDKYYAEISELDKQENSYFKIIKDYNYSENKYIPTKDEFLRYVAYFRYMGEKFKDASKKYNGSSKISSRGYDTMFNIDKTYDEYLEYLKTEEALRSRDEKIYNRTLRVISNNIDNLSEEEHKDAYEKIEDVFKGKLYNKLIISDDKNEVIVTKDNYDALIRFFSTEEIKVLVTYIDQDMTSIQNQNIEVPFNVIDEVPTLKDCKGLTTNLERKRCLSTFVSKFVNDNFNKNITDSLKLKGKQRIFTSFKIDKQGKVIAVKARANNSVLEQEAIRVIKRLPQFIPGKQKGKTVIVPYSLPIVFQITSNNTSECDSYLEEKEDQEKTGMSFYKVDEPPVHPDCASYSNSKDITRCTNKLINQLVSEKFDKAMVKKLKITDGKQRIFATMIIGKDGVVKKISAKGSNEKAREEVIKVLKQIPSFKPGKHNGKLVEVYYDIPIVFKIDAVKTN